MMTQQEVPPMRKSSIFAWLLAGATLFLYFIAVFSSMMLLPRDTFLAWRSRVTQRILNRDYIVARDKLFGPSYTVDTVHVNKNSFIVLKTRSMFNTPGDFIVGTPVFLTPGVHRQVEISIDQDQLARSIETYGVRRQEVYVVMYSDSNGDGALWSEDKIVKDIYGQPYFTRINLL